MTGVNLKKIGQAVISVTVPIETLPTKGKITNKVNNNNSNCDNENNGSKINNKFQ